MWKLALGLFFKKIASWAAHVGFWFSCLTGSKGIRAHLVVPIITILYIQEDDDFHHHQPLLFFGKGGLQRALVYLKVEFIGATTPKMLTKQPTKSCVSPLIQKKIFVWTNGVIMLTREIFQEETWIEKNNEMVVRWGFA